MAKATDATNATTGLRQTTLPFRRGFLTTPTVALSVSLAAFSVSAVMT
ncbi:MAG: hypothetical protein O3A84_14130 [Proteobacteria bacterium]|nr:hypothetical protein [Pseudomonadota bacterium]